jgi:hypothetical protein
MCSANKQELCSVAGFTNEDPNKVPPYVGRFLLIEACDRDNRSHRLDPVGRWWHCNKCTKKNSGDREEINSSFSTSFHKKEISGMYINIFDVFQGATTREIFAAVTFPSPTTKISTMVRTLLINILCTVC